MKPEKKPFVVEIKNRRSLSRRERPIWGNIDLKAAADQVSVEQAAEGADAVMEASLPRIARKQEPADAAG